MTDKQTPPDPDADAKAGIELKEGTAFQDLFDQALPPSSRTGLNFFTVPRGLGGHMSNTTLHLSRGKGDSNGR